MLNIYILVTGGATNIIGSHTYKECVTLRRVPFIVGPKSPGDPAALVSDAPRAMQALGWCPQLDDIDTMIYMALECHNLQISKGIK
jgi:UDP-glucose 4-epimerase